MKTRAVLGKEYEGFSKTKDTGPTFLKTDLIHSVVFACFLHVDEQ